MVLRETFDHISSFKLCLQSVSIHSIHLTSYISLKTSHFKTLPMEMHQCLLDVKNMENITSHLCSETADNESSRKCSFLNSRTVLHKRTDTTEEETAGSAGLEEGIRRCVIGTTGRQCLLLPQAYAVPRDPRQHPQRLWP